MVAPTYGGHISLPSAPNQCRSYRWLPLLIKPSLSDILGILAYLLADSRNMSIGCRETTLQQKSESESSCCSEADAISSPGPVRSCIQQPEVCNESLPVTSPSFINKIGAKRRARSVKTLPSQAQNDPPHCHQFWILISRQRDYLFSFWNYLFKLCLLFLSLAATRQGDDRHAQVFLRGGALAPNAGGV